MVSKALTTEVFDYDSEVDKETKGKLITLAGQVKRGKAFYVKNAIEIGCALHEAHELLAGKGRDGKFRQWFECECGLEKSTAYNYLNSFNAFSKFDSVAQLSAGAMYELALPSTPPAARKEAMKRASQGVKINRKVADEIIGEFTVDESPAKEVSNVGHLSKPQASVTGTPATSTASSPDLPSVGTVNRTESGSQGSGDAGECPKEDYGKCPNCAGTKWTEDIECGVVCSRCSHPHGEPAGEVDDQRKTDARSKTIKTAEALMRAFDDLNLLASHPKEHANAIATCKILLKTARDWR